MATGLPVVTTDVGASAEAVQDGVTGTVVPPLAPGAVAAAALALLDDPARRTAMGRAGRERAMAEYSPARIADLHVAAFTAAREYAARRRDARRPFTGRRAGARVGKAGAGASPDAVGRPLPPRLAVVQGTLPDYRVALFALLADQIGAGFEVWTGDEGFQPTIRSVAPLPPWGAPGHRPVPLRVPAAVAAAAVPPAAPRGRRARRAQPARALDLGRRSCCAAPPAADPCCGGPRGRARDADRGRTPCATRSAGWPRRSWSTRRRSGHSCSSGCRAPRSTRRRTPWRARPACVPRG